MKRLLVILLLLSIALGLFYGLYTYFKPSEDITQKKAELSIGSDNLINAFSEDAVAAHERYTGKVMSVSGTIASIEQLDDAQTGISFDNGGAFIISFQLSTFNAEAYPIGKQLVVKGQYNGFLPPDDLFGMPGNIQMTQCIVESQ